MLLPSLATLPKSAAQLLVLGLLTIVLMTSCRGSARYSSSRLKMRECQLMIDIARDKVMGCNLGLTDDHAAIIVSSDPIVSYYLLSGMYGQYSIRWRLSDEKSVVVSGTGDVTRLENAQVSITN